MATSSKVSVQSQVKIENIGVLTDFSNEATRALRFAVAFARAFDAGITLAHSYIPPSFAYAAPEVSLVYQAIGDMEQSLKKNLVDQAKAAFLHGIKCSTVLRVGGPKDLLEDLSGMDLIVVGTKGESGIEKDRLGIDCRDDFPILCDAGADGWTVLPIGSRVTVFCKDDSLCNRLFLWCRGRIAVCSFVRTKIWS